MLSRRSGTALAVKTHTSTQLLLLMLFMHGLAVFLLWPLAEQFGVLVLFALLILFFSLVWTLRRFVFLSSKYSVTEIILKSSGEYLLELRGGGYVEANLRRGSYVHPLLIILNFKLSKWPWYINVPLLTDSADKELLRCLRVRLRTLRDGEMETLA